MESYEKYKIDLYNFLFKVKTRNIERKRLLLLILSMMIIIVGHMQLLIMVIHLLLH